MFIDAREVEFGTVLKRDVCIIGAGIAGITIAQELDRLGIEACIVESGGFKLDEEIRDLGRGESVGLPAEWVDGRGARIVGGNSRFWDGFCRPLDELDFQKRDWIPHSGWPFTKSDLTRYYEHAATVLKLGPAHLDPSYWLDKLGHRDRQRARFLNDRVIDRVSQYSPVKRVARMNLKHLRASERLTVLLHATAIEIETDPAARTVRRICVVTLRGRKVFVSARGYVLAGGGIENARLLLASNRVRAAGLGNGHDLVGRFFMDHPQVLSGEVHPSDSWTGHTCYDDKADLRTSATGGTRFSTQYSLSPEIQKTEGLLNGLVWLSSNFGIEGTEIGRSFINIKRALTHRYGRRGEPVLRDVGMLLAHPLLSVRLVLADWLKPNILRRGIQFRAMVEPVPDPESRVTLSDELDQVGMRRVRVDWRFPPLVSRTFDRNLGILAEELERAGIAKVRLDSGQDWSNHCMTRPSGHHMGTTRMHDSSTYGVVDRNCLVHGMHNLFIAGSSVFPTAGAHVPTMTVVALSLRLAEYIVKRINQAASLD
jgi:choline dehydrogenase-like flavoprotein